MDDRAASKEHRNRSVILIALGIWKIYAARS